MHICEIMFIPQSLHFQSNSIYDKYLIKVFWVASFCFFFFRKRRQDSNLFLILNYAKKNILKWLVLKRAAFSYHFLPTFSQVSYRHVQWAGGWALPETKIMRPKGQKQLSARFLNPAVSLIHSRFIHSGLPTALPCARPCAYQGTQSDRREICHQTKCYFLFRLPLSSPFTGKLLAFWILHNFRSAWHFHGINIHPRGSPRMYLS